MQGFKKPRRYEKNYTTELFGVYGLWLAICNLELGLIKLGIWSGCNFSPINCKI
jgi:hypothetical protein